MRKIVYLFGPSHVYVSIRIELSVNTTITWLLNNRREILSVKHALRSQHGLFSLY